MYKVGDVVHVVSVKFQIKRRLVARRLYQCLILTKGQTFRPKTAMAVSHVLEITEVIDHGNGKYGYVGYKKLSANGMQFLIGHCNYPTVPRRKNGEYLWTIYHIKLNNRRNAVPEISIFEDISIIDKWIEEKVYVSAYLRRLRHSCW